MKVKMTADARIAPHGDTVSKGATIDVPDNVGEQLIADKKAKRMVARGADVKASIGEGAGNPDPANNPANDPGEA